MEKETLIKGSAELNKMFAAVQKTGASLRRDFGEVENLQQSLRGSVDFVSKAAKRIEEDIISELAFVRPMAGILTPNVSQEGDGRDEFVLSLSGAANFVRGIPNFAISLALVSNDETKIGLIYSPIDDKLYYAEAGSGSFIFTAYHSTRTNVSVRTDKRDLTVATDNSAHDILSKFIAANIRMTGCPALDLSYVASGKFDMFVSDHLDYSEICAGQLLVLESGGKFYEQNGEIIASNKSI